MLLDVRLKNWRAPSCEYFAAQREEFRQTYRGFSADPDGFAEAS